MDGMRRSQAATPKRNVGALRREGERSGDGRLVIPLKVPPDVSQEAEVMTR